MGVLELRSYQTQLCRKKVLSPLTARSCEFVVLYGSCKEALQSTVEMNCVSWPPHNYSASSSEKKLEHLLCFQNWTSLTASQFLSNLFFHLAAHPYSPPLLPLFPTLILTLLFVQR